MDFISRILSYFSLNIRDHRELDYTYEKMRDELQDIKRGIADLTTQKKRLEAIQERATDDSVPYSGGRRFSEQLDMIEKSREELLEEKDRLEQQIEALRTRKETQRAKQEASRASNKVIGVLSNQMGKESDADALMERTLARVDDIESNRDNLARYSLDDASDLIESTSMEEEQRISTELEESDSNAEKNSILDEERNSKLES